MRALIWLLRHSLVEKQRTYVRVVASEQIKRESALRWSGKLRKDSDAGLSRDEATSGSSFLSTSASATSDHSIAGGLFQRAAGGGGGVGDAFYPRSRQTSVRPELDDTNGMEIKLSGAAGASPSNAAAAATASSARADEAMLSRSASSVLSARALRMGRDRKAPTSFGSGGKVRPSTVSDHSDDPRDGGATTRGPCVIVEPGRPSMYESRWLSEMCKGKDATTVDRFERW